MIATKWARAQRSARTQRRAAAAQAALQVARKRCEEILGSPTSTTRDGRVSDAALDAAVARRLELRELAARVPALEKRAAAFVPTPLGAAVRARLWNALGAAEWLAGKAALALAGAWAFQHPKALWGACEWLRPALAWALRHTA